MTKKEKQIVYNKVFGSADGEKVLADLMKYCHMLEFESDLNPENITFRAGRRDVIMNILINMKYKEKSIISKIEESINE